MSTKDIIKNSIYKGLGSSAGLSASEIILILIIACCIGLYIYIIYKVTSKSALYSRDLNITLSLLTVIVAAIIIAMQSSLVVSLGMVGALSIVRFRNAIKNPLDLAYLFWAMSSGIICGVRLYLLAIALCVIMTALLLILGRIPNTKAPSLLVIRAYSNINYDALYQVIYDFSKYSKEKSRSIKKGETELIIELKTLQENSLLEALNQISGIIQINFLSHDGELRV